MVVDGYFSDFPFFLSLSLSLFDLLSIVMFMGVWWWIFGGGGSLMVGIDGGGYFVWVFDGGYLLAVCVWWWVLVVMSVLWWVNGGRWLEFDGSGCLLVVCVWWWVFVVGGGGAMVALVVGCFAVVNPWMGMGIQKNGYGEERQWIGERELNFFYIICWCSLYYFNKLHIKNRNWDIGWFVKWDGKINKINFKGVK